MIRLTTVRECSKPSRSPRVFRRTSPRLNTLPTPHAQAIAAAAKRLDELRNNWLNPSDLVRVEPEIVAGFPDRIVPKDTQAAALLRERALTNLYNEPLQWLLDAHREVDVAVAGAYGWPNDIPEHDALTRLIALNASRKSASKGSAEEDVPAENAEVEGEAC